MDPKSILKLIQLDDLNSFKNLITNQDYFIKLNNILIKKYGSSLVHLCSKYNSKQIFQWIFSENLFNDSLNYLNIRDFEGKTPLHTACIFNSLDVCRLIIQHGADVNDLKRGDWSSLMVVVTKLNIPLINLLLENGVDISIQNKDGWNVLHFAIRTGDLSIVKLFYTYQQDNHHPEDLWYHPVNNGRTIMHIAAIHGFTHIFDFILTHFNFQKLFLKDRCGVNPFMDASRANCVEICQMIQTQLLKQPNIKFNVNECDNSGRSALHMAAQANANDSIKYLHSILKCDLNLRDAWQQTALFLSVREGHFESTKLLIDLGANCNLVDQKQRTIIDICTQYQHKHLLLLFDHKQHNITNDF